MKVEKILRLLKEKGDEPETWGQIARDLGHELPRNRLEVLRDFRARVSTAVESMSESTKIALNMLLEVTAAYEVVIEERERTEEIRVFVQTKGWGPVLRRLLRGATRVSEIVKEFRLEDGYASEMLSAMNFVGIVNASQSVDPLCYLTVLGQDIAGQLSD